MDNNGQTVEQQAEERLKDKNRYSELSEKVIQEKIKNDALARERDEANKKAADMTKEASFYKDFSANIGKYPSASEYQEKILEKVRSGYSTEDAMVSVLAKEGKLSSPSIERPSVQVEGGSAPNISGGNKSIQEMSRAEKLAALMEADKTGALSDAIRGRG